jgi:methionine aminopeptidase
MIDTNSKYYQSYRENGRLIARIKAKAVDFAQIHHNLVDIDNYVDSLIQQAGGEPAFKKVPSYKWATCISVNSGFVHGIPKVKFTQVI